METQTITLETPLKRGETTIATVDLRRPLSGALRGCSTRRLLDMETDDLFILLPRISSPSLLPAELKMLDPADLLKMGSVVAGFLLPKSALETDTETPTTEAPAEAPLAERTTD